jgi:hypothetical protein
LAQTLAVVALACTLAAQAQDRFEAAGTPLPDYVQMRPLRDLRGPAERLTPADNELPNIMITGYWPPTNEMLRQFSPNPEQNPGGWVGENWEGRGYNIYAFFPEFPSGLGKGEGDFEVDYEDTSNDWWPIVAQLEPIAIITFSRASTVRGWELEGGNRTYVSGDWTADYLAPRRPTPDLPIMIEEPPGTERFSTLPIDAIIQAVADSGAHVDPFSTVIDDGRFLSNFIGYHGCWYHTLHPDPSDPAWCVASGHIHVGGSAAVADCVLATEVTLRTLIDHVDQQTFVPGDLDGDRDVDLSDLAILLAHYPTASGAAYEDGDLDGDGDVDLSDLAALLAVYGTGP